MKKFTINKKKKSILFISVLAILVLISGMLVGCGNQDTVSDETISEVESVETTEEPTSTPEVTAEPESTEEPTSTPEATEEPTSTPEAPEPTEEPTPQPTEKPEPTEKPSEPTPQPETPKPQPEEPKPHTHSYTTSVTQPTCTTQGYTTYTCACGHSYKDNYVNGSHNYSNGTCTVCGTADPNYVPPHTHSWTDKTWTEDAVTETQVEVLICRCNIEWSSMSDLKAHQDAVPQCTGWCNTYKWIETITQIIHHYRECACGAREDID